MIARPRSRAQPSFWRGFLRWLVAALGVCLGVCLLGVAAFTFAMWRGSWSIDRDGGPIPDWLPAGTTELRLRGSTMQTWFFGRCDRAALEHWTQERRMPLKEHGRADVWVFDLAQWPIAGRRPDQTVLTEVERLIYESRAADGGGFSLIYLPDRGVFYGDRSWW